MYCNRWGPEIPGLSVRVCVCVCVCLCVCLFALERRNYWADFDETLQKWSHIQGCQLLRFGRSFIRFPSLTTPENTPSKNYAEQKFRSDSSIFVKFRSEVISRSLGEPAEPRFFSEIARDFARLSNAIVHETFVRAVSCLFSQNLS